MTSLDQDSPYQRGRRSRKRSPSIADRSKIELGCEPSSMERRKGGWRSCCRILFGVGSIICGVVMLAPPLAEPPTVERGFTIGGSLLYLYVGWLFLADRHSKFLKLPF